jgi:hypothetical protein
MLCFLFVKNLQAFTRTLQFIPSNNTPSPNDT